MLVNISTLGIKQFVYKARITRFVVVTLLTTGLIALVIAPISRVYNCSSISNTLSSDKTLPIETDVVASVHLVDLDNDGNNERVTYFYTKTQKGISTFIKIENTANKIPKTLYDSQIEATIYPLSSYNEYFVGKITGFVNLPGNNHGIVIKTSVQGSGGFTGYKVIAKQNGRYVVIYEQNDLKNGKISITGGGDYIQEESDAPLLGDSNCCSTNIKYKLISFSSDFRPTIREISTANYWLILTKSE